MKSLGKCVSSRFVLVALLAITVACGTTRVVTPDPPDVQEPLDAAEPSDAAEPPDVAEPPVSPPVTDVDPADAETPPMVPLTEHQKVVADLTEARGLVKKLETANAELAARNASLTEDNKILQKELTVAKAEAGQLQKKLDAILSPPPVPSKDQKESGGSVVESYTVQPGDSFEHIAAKTEIYGNSERWQDLYEANRERLGLARPEDLQAGMELEIKRP